MSDVVNGMIELLLTTVHAVSSVMIKSDDCLT